MRWCHSQSFAIRNVQFCHRALLAHKDSRRASAALQPTILVFRPSAILVAERRRPCQVFPIARVRDPGPEGDLCPSSLILLVTLGSFCLPARRRELGRLSQCSRARNAYYERPHTDVALLDAVRVAPECEELPLRTCVRSAAISGPPSGSTLGDGPTADEQQLHRHYSISSSASSRIEGDIVNPRDCAVLRLTTRRKRVGCSRGRLAGLSPFRMRSTKLAPR